MLWSSLYIVITFFAVGAIALAILNMNEDIDKAKGRWIKYLFYLIIVAGTIWCIYKGYMQNLAIGLLFIGTYEICKGWRSSKRGVVFLGVSIIFFLVLSFFFYGFSVKMSSVSILYVYMIVFTFDGFAQLTGQLFGKRKILPNISPNKTIAGVIGGTLMGSATGIYMTRWLEISGNAIWVSPLVICASAFVGDILASWYKRMCLIKDYSKLIPEHGGILDRYDSFIFAGIIFGLLYS